MVLVSDLGEFAGGLLFAFGLITPLAALALTVVMLNAIGTNHWKKSFFNSAGGYEFNIAVLATAAGIASDGYRVLVDRLWQRGVSKKRAKLDEWERNCRRVPSCERGHDPSRFAEFRRRYTDELRRERPRLTALRRRARDVTLTLIYSAHDEEHNDALVLANVLHRELPKKGKRP